MPRLELDALRRRPRRRAPGTAEGPARRPGPGLREGSARCAAGLLVGRAAPMSRRTRPASCSYDRRRFAHQLDDACVVVGVEALVTAQDVGGLRGRPSAAVRPVERDRLEVEQPLPCPRRRSAAADAVSGTTGVGTRACRRRCCVDQLDLHVDGRRQLRVRGPQCAQFRDFAWIWRRGRGASGRIARPTLS